MLIDVYRLHSRFIGIKQVALQSCSVIEFSLSRRWQHYVVPEKGPWKILFFGADDFSLPSFRSLYKEYRLNNLCRLEVVTTSRSKNNVVASYAMEHGIVVNTWPISFDVVDFHIGIVVSFGHLIPSHIIQSFPLGILNIHASLLPRWRGAAPIIYSLMNGDTYTGITIMNVLPKRFDIGEIIAQEQTDIGSHETQPELRSKLANMGADLLIKTIEKLPWILSQKRPQNEMEATYAPRITSKLSLINWGKMSAKDIYNLHRALMGLYSVTTRFQDMTIKLLEIREVERPRDSLNVQTDTPPGTAKFDKKKNLLIVRCIGDTYISIAKVIIPGRRPMTASDFNNGFISRQKQKIIVFQ